MDNYGDQPTAFYFQVKFCAQKGITDTSFKEVSGISQSIRTDEYKELGENGFAYKIPVGITYSNLILKRGIAPLDSPLVKWCQSVFDNMLQNPICCMPITVYLMDAEGKALRGWNFMNAFPVKWDVESFGSMKNEVAIESIEFEYQYSNRII